MYLLLLILFVFILSNEKLRINLIRIFDIITFWNLDYFELYDYYNAISYNFWELWFKKKVWINYLLSIFKRKIFVVYSQNKDWSFKKIIWYIVFNNKRKKVIIRNDSLLTKKIFDYKDFI